MVYNKIPRILCVDDDVLILNAFEIAFNEIFNIYTAKSADEAYKILEKSDIDIIIADHNMPKVTGVELLEKVSFKYPDVIRILATAQDDNLFIIKALNKTQLFAFFNKPLDLDNVKEIIIKAFEFKKLRDENSELQKQLTASNEQFVELTNYLQKEIAEKNNLYAELKKSQLQFNQALSISKIGHWHLDIINNKTTISDEVYRIFGFEPNEIDITFEIFSNYIHPEDKNFVLEAISVSHKNNSPYDLTHRVLLRNGEIKYVKEIGLTIQNSNGEPVESFGTIKDVTINKLHQENSEKTILIVDDDAATILLVEKICSINNYKTISADNASKALKLLENNQPDLILLDFRLPDINGFDLCKKIKTLSQEIFLVPVIFLTAYSDYNSIVEGLKLGAVDFITKPFHIEELLAKLKNHLELYHYHKFYKEQTTEQLFENEKALKIKNFELENLIAEVQNSKNALKESQEKFSKAFFSNPAIGVITTVNDNRITEINQSFTKFLGYSPDEVIGKTTLEINLFEDEIKRAEFIEKLQKNGFLHNEKFRFRHKNGNILTLTWSVEIIEIKNVICTISTGIDITQQIKFQEELVNKNIELRDAKEQTLSALEEYMVINDDLTASEERYREIVEGSDNLILEINSFGSILYVNKASQNILGINPKLCIGLSIFDFVPKEDIFRTTKKIKNWIINKYKSKSFENRILSNTGVISNFQWTINFHYNDFDDLISVKGIGKDITEQKKSEARLKHSESALKLAQKAAKIGHWELNIEKNTFYLSDEIYNILRNMF